MENMNLDAFSPKKAELEVVVAQFKDLKINWVDDKEWFKAVHEAQMVLKKHRVNIKNTRLDYTRQFDEAKKKAMDFEKELVWIIEPLEIELKEKKEAIEQEKAKIKEQQEIEKEKELNKKIQLLWKYWATIDLFNLKMMWDEEFDTYLNNAKTQFEKEQEEKRLQEEKEAEERKKQEEEAEKLRKEREEFDIQKKKQEEDQRKMDEEKNKLENEKNKIANEKLEEQRKKDEEKRIEEAKIQAKKEAEEEAKKREEEQKRKDEEESRLKQEQLEKDKKYKDFLKKHEWQYDDKIKIDWKTTLIKIIAQYEI